MRFAVIQALAFFASIFTVLIITLTPIGARILNKLHVDSSAQARFDVFIILQSSSLSLAILTNTDKSLSSDQSSSYHALSQII